MLSPTSVLWSRCTAAGLPRSASSRSGTRNVTVSPWYCVMLYPVRAISSFITESGSLHPTSWP